MNSTAFECVCVQAGGQVRKEERSELSLLWPPHIRSTQWEAEGKVRESRIQEHRNAVDRPLFFVSRSASREASWGLERLVSGLCRSESELYQFNKGTSDEVQSSIVCRRVCMYKHDCFAIRGQRRWLT